MRFTFVFWGVGFPHKMTGVGFGRDFRPIDFRIVFCILVVMVLISLYERDLVMAQGREASTETKELRKIVKDWTKGDFEGNSVADLAQRLEVEWKKSNPKAKPEQHKTKITAVLNEKRKGLGLVKTRVEGTRAVPLPVDDNLGLVLQVVEKLGSIDAVRGQLALIERIWAVRPAQDNTEGSPE